MKKKKNSAAKAIIFPPALAVLCIIGCCGCAKKEPLHVQNVNTAMGTIIQQNLYLKENTEEKGIADGIMNVINSLERDTLSWRLDTSEIYAVNRTVSQATDQITENGVTSAVQISDELADILESCQKVSADSGGAFDITIGEVARLWNIDEYTADATGFQVPDERELERALADCGYEKLMIDGKKITLPKGMQLDLGAVGKGIALTEIAEYLQREQAVTGATVSVGGSILTYGSKPDKSDWMVGIVNPTDTSRQIGYLALQGQWCVSTSGDYERYVEIAGVRYHHILDPANGYPADSGVHSVTILSEDGLLSDALSTACFILGKEKGMELAEKYNAEALFVDANGETAMTEGMQRYFHLS